MEQRPPGHDKFMTQKEKDFVSFLFERALKKKEKRCPNFYMCGNKFELPEDIKSEQKKEEERDGRNGRDSRDLSDGRDGRNRRDASGRKNEKQGFGDSSGIITKRPAQCISGGAEEGKQVQIVKKRIASRNRIEEIYGILVKERIYEKQGGENARSEHETTEEIVCKLKEIGEDLFNMEKGLALVKRLVFEDTREEGLAAGEKRRKEVEKAVCTALVQKIRYIGLCPELCLFISSALPLITKNIDIMRIDPCALAGMFLHNGAGAVVGNIALLVFKKQDEAFYREVCARVSSMLVKEKIQRAFSKIPHHLLWKLLSVVVQGVPPEEAALLRARLAEKAEEGLKGRSVVVVESVRVFLKRSSR